MADEPTVPQPASSLPPWMSETRQPKESAPGAATSGRALRQHIPTPDTESLLARQRELVTFTDSSGAGLGESSVGTPTSLTDRDLPPTRFPTRDALFFYNTIRSSAALKLAVPLQEAPKLKPGRPAEVSTSALLVGLFLTVQRGKGCLMNEVANTLYRKLYPDAMALLGLRPVDWVPEPDPDTQPTEVWERLRVQRRRQLDACNKRVARAFHRLCDSMDPSVHAAGRVIPWTTHRERARDLTEAEIEDRMNWLVYFCNDIVRLPWQLLPAKVRAMHDGSAGIDATHVTLFARGRSANSRIAAIEPMGGYWVRTGDHSEGRPTHTRYVFAYDLHMIVAADWHGKGEFFPALPLAMFITRPGEDPSGAFRRMATNYAAAVNGPRKYLAGDGLYTNAAPGTFQNPARELGWDPVLSMPDARLGLQGVVEDFHAVEGNLYCPSMPQKLADATRDFRAGRITQDEYNLLIRERKKYEVRLKETISPNKFRFGCPASGKKPTVMCANKPASETPDRRVLISGADIKVRERIHPPSEFQAAEHRPTCCIRDTVTIDLTAHPELARTYQPIDYGTPEHVDVYNTLRDSHEGFHGFVKDEAKEDLAAAGKRRVHGFAASWIMIAVTVAAAGVRKVRSFLEKAHMDKNGTLYLPREQRSGDHARTGLPPGTMRLRDGP